jgi:GTPase Era involved in 16S rRNA processing
LERFIDQSTQFLSEVDDGTNRFRCFLSSDLSRWIVDNVTRRQSFKNWIHFLTQQGNTPFVIAGNKEDLAQQAEVTPEDATLFAQTNDVTFFQTSAKTRSNVKLSFRQRSSRPSG